MSAIVHATPFSAPQPALPKAEPCVVVILGASGDLTQRKLVPALFRLACAGCMSRDFSVIGVGRTRMTDAEFRARMKDGAAASKEIGAFTETEWRDFEGRLQYLAGALDENETYERIAARLEALHASGASTNRLFYCATPPSLVQAVLRGVDAAHLASEDSGWSRIVVEKPFGRDLESARALNDAIAAVFDEHQVYRIDHYLGKETVRNILVFRFGNTLFEPVWNRNYIDYVEITAAETVGVGGRAGYYEQAGALRDMVANHLLQLVALTAMEPPAAFDADSLREHKRQVWQSIRRMTPEDIAARTVRGQYGAGRIDGSDVPGYRQEKDVQSDSSVETYVALELRIENWRWAGVPFYVRTGKRLGRAVTEIAVHFKATPQALFSRTQRDTIEANTIVLRIQPDEGIVVAFGAKLPGTDMRVGTVNMDFCYSRAFGVRSPAAYETLLLDVMRGDATLFVRRDGIEAQWNIITPIEEAWTSEPKRIPDYAAGSEGPAAADALPARNGHRWRPLASATSC